MLASVEVTGLNSLIYIIVRAAMRIAPGDGEMQADQLKGHHNVKEYRSLHRWYRKSISG
jgi:hypothetical protein